MQPAAHMNDMSEVPRKIFARRGEVVTCVQGHAVCAMSRDVYEGERDPKIFCDWQQPEPDKTTPINKIRCVHCRGVWIRKGGGSYRLHFAGGWR